MASGVVVVVSVVGDVVTFGALRQWKLQETLEDNE